MRLADGSRVRSDIPEPKCRSKTGARNYVAWAQQEEDRDHAIYNATIARRKKREATVAMAAGETCDAWYERFMLHRRSEVGSVDDDKWRWTKWISPRIGAKAIREVTPDDVEDVRDALTAAVLAYEAASCVTGDGRLAPKTAQNFWASMTTAFKYASTRKGPRELRVREDLGNPCADMPPPRDGASKQRHWCRPGEVLAILCCKDVPLAWREAIAVGCYLHLRPGEIHELRIRDLDLDVGEVRIARAFDERERIVKTPKTDEGIRTVTIPATLVPLLKRIADEHGDDDLVAPIVAATQEKNRAGLFRSFLKSAKVTRAELFVETQTHLMIDFRSLRDSGITWRFLAGERAEVVQREAGHEDLKTTLGYAKEVQDRGGRYGEPFPALPPDLIDPTKRPTGHASGPPEGEARRNAHLDVSADASERLPISIYADEARSRAFSNPASPTMFHEVT